MFVCVPFTMCGRLFFPEPPLSWGTPSLYVLVLDSGSHRGGGVRVVVLVFVLSLAVCGSIPACYQVLCVLLGVFHPRYVCVPPFDICGRLCFPEPPGGFQKVRRGFGFRT